MSASKLPLSYFNGPTPERAADLLGRTLCHRSSDGSISRARITETEAYDGMQDLACHAHVGRTKRTTVMFDRPGRAYVYLCYGIHWLLNIVTRPPGTPAAILIRGVEGVQGPGRLTRAFGISGELNALPLHKKNGLWIESTPTAPPGQVDATPRIGIDYAGPEWAAVPWRFVWNQGKGSLGG